MSLPAGHRPNDQRIDQLCDACGQIDKHPRTHILQADGSTKTVHLDCDAAAGGEASRALLEEHGNAHGDKLVTALTKGM